MARAVNPEPVVLVVGQLDHSRISDRAPQPVVERDVDHLAVAGGSSGAQPHGVWCARHRVKPAGEHAIGLVSADHRRTQCERAHARQTDIVERDAGHVARYAAEDRRSPSGILAVGRLEDVADRM